CGCSGNLRLVIGTRCSPASARNWSVFEMSAAAELFARGTALAQAGKLHSAVNCFRACVEQNPDWPEALSNLGNALREVGRSGEAIRLLERALRLRPEFPEALVNLAVLVEERGDLEEARRLLD